MYCLRVSHLFIILSLFLLLLCGCMPTAADQPVVAPITSAALEPTQETAALTPEQVSENVTPFEVPETSSVVPHLLAPTADMDPVAVTQAFYDWYFSYIGDRGSGSFRDPLVDKAYHGNPLLTPDFIARADETLSGFEGGGSDPFLQAQDIPQDMFATWPVITGDTARVTVLRNWGPPSMDAIFAHLKRDCETWLIEDITSVQLYEPTSDTPEGTVQQFYAWYTDALRPRYRMTQSSSISTTAICSARASKNIWIR